MIISQCNHFRIRNNNEYGMDVERFIKFIEKQYKMDFRKIPQWKELIKELHAAKTEYMKKIQASKYRKCLIINKIYTENARPSPFQLTEDLARTSRKWEASRCKIPKICIEEKTEDIAPDAAEYDEISGELSETKFTAHPNTEIVPSEDVIEQQLKSEVETEVEPSHLPTSVCINQHKLITPLRSNDSFLSYKSGLNEIEITPEGEPKEWLFLEPTSVIKCIPKEIIVINPTLKEQCLNFSLLNCTTEYMHVRFKSVTERAPFKRLKILPVTPFRLYPGISVTFKLIFKLSQTEEFPSSSLYFRVGRNVLLQGPTESLLIPIVSMFKASRKVFVPKIVSFAPAYSWHINEKIGFPTEWVKISNGDCSNYHLHVVKRLYDFAKEAGDSILSLDVLGPNTESILQRVDDNEVEILSKTFSPSKGDDLPTVTEVESLKTIDVIALVVDEIVELALGAFVFEHTYLDVHPHTKRHIPVYFTKAEHTGFHQCYYDFEFCDPVTEQIILTKTMRMYAEVLPHPVQVHPVILDMSNSPITHGFCTDNFIITNTHKLYPVTAKVKLTTKMKKLFHVLPTEVTIPAKSNASIKVRLCSRSFASESKSADLAHFTIKIIFRGHESIYNNIPPFFYEIIAPCALEFKKVYNEKYYIEVSEKSQQELSCSKIMVRTTSL